MWRPEEVGGIVPAAVSFGAVVSQTSHTTFLPMSADRREMCLLTLGLGSLPGKATCGFKFLWQSTIMQWS